MMARWLLCVMLLPLALGAHAQERILDYDVTLDIQADGALEVTETIRVRAQGQQIRRGIYRDFPTRYKDRLNNRVRVDFELLDVQRDGRPEPHFTESRFNGVRINTGDDSLLAVPAEYTYTLRYRTTRQLGFFADHDELYWNATGTGWVFPIEQATVRARLPQRVPSAQLAVEAYTGKQGGKGMDYVAEVPADGLAQWQTTRPLAPREGITVVLTFPKGVIAPPTMLQRVRWFLGDNRGALIALMGLLGLIGWCVSRWLEVGRSPPAGVIIARYEPPPGHTPGGLRYLWRKRYDDRCFTSALLAAGVAGKLRIEHEGGRRGKWALQRMAALPESPDGTDGWLRQLFSGSGAERLELKPDNAAQVNGAKLQQHRVLKKAYEPRYLETNSGSVWTAVAITVITAALAIWIGRGAGVLVMGGILLLMVGVLVAFAILMRRPTVEGRKLLDHAEGLKRYLSVAERDELKGLAGPDQPAMNAQHYEQLLPWAVALQVEDAWTGKFTAAVGAAAAAAAAAGYAWYRGDSISDLGKLASSMGSGLSSQIAASSSAPGSSSGSGGGGSSGGGGGGGGGGGR